MSERTFLPIKSCLYSRLVSPGTSASIPRLRVADSPSKEFTLRLVVRVGRKSEESVSKAVKEEFPEASDCLSKVTLVEEDTRVRMKGTVLRREREVVLDGRLELDNLLLASSQT